MSTVALYRKYRPEKFNEIIGQEKVVSVLVESIKNNQISHAYLFSGPRGVGKTSIARILARELDCRGNDLYEIDGASNNGVDEIRELKESVRTLPFESPRKVYIIDEVHMLSKAAFNALLKTLEEPPAHVVFILATTELAKVPDTIISRCQTYVFNKPAISDLEQALTKVLKKEGCKLKAESIRLIAMLAEGSFRDALGILQKVISLSVDKELSPAEVSAITGAPRRELLETFLLGIMEKATEKSLTAIQQLISENGDCRLFLKLAMEQIRLAMLLAYGGKTGEARLADLSLDEQEFIRTLANHESKRQLPKILFELLTIYPQIYSAYRPELPLELAVVKMGGEN